MASSYIAIASPSIVANNVAVGIVPNSCKYKGGKGEAKMRAASTGGGNVTTVYTQDDESRISSLKFALYPSPANIALIEDWQARLNTNAFSVTSPGFSKMIANAAVIADPEAALGADTTIEVEIMGSAAV